MLIRKATSEDASGILACLSAAFDEYRDSHTSSAFAETVLTAEKLAKRLQEMTGFVVVEKSGEIVGTIACGVVNAEKATSGGWRFFPVRKAAVLRHSPAPQFFDEPGATQGLDSSIPLEHEETPRGLGSYRCFLSSFQGYAF